MLSWFAALASQAASMPDCVAKTACACFQRLPPRWLQYRVVVQRWDETMSNVAEADLSKDEYKQLEDTVLKDSVIDQEILSMLQRHPGVFHMGMQPSCSSRQLNVDEAAKAVATALKEAASG